MSVNDKVGRQPESRAVGTPGPAENGWVTARTTQTRYTTTITVRGFELVADEPADAGGDDSGPTPYEYLLGALGSCTAMTLRMYAERKAWPLGEIVVRLRDVPSHAADCANCETEAVGIRRLERLVELHGALTDEQRERLLAIADRCPIKQTLERGLVIKGGAQSVVGREQDG
jgi:putative redox protein